MAKKEAPKSLKLTEPQETPDSLEVDASVDLPLTTPEPYKLVLTMEVSLSRCGKSVEEIKEEGRALAEILSSQGLGLLELTLEPFGGHYDFIINAWDLNAVMEVISLNCSLFNFAHFRESRIG